MRAKAAGIEMSMYTKATNLPGFFAEPMWSLACESSLEVRRTSSNVRHAAKTGETLTTFAAGSDRITG